LLAGIERLAVVRKGEDDHVLLEGNGQLDVAGRRRVADDVGANLFKDDLDVVTNIGVQRPSFEKLAQGARGMLETLDRGVKLEEVLGGRRRRLEHARQLPGRATAASASA